MSGLHRDINAPRHETEVEAKLGQAQGARPGSLGARPPVGAKSGLFRPGYSTNLLDQEKHSTTSPIDPKTHRRGGLYKQGPLAPGGDKKLS